jgi:hypothetical protein
MAVAGMALATLASPPTAAAYSCTPCIPSFQEYLGDAPVAVYRLDRTHSRWSERKDWLDVDGSVSCGLSGTLVFRRIDTIRGRAPAAITLRMKTIDDSCPWYGGYTLGVPTGRWIVVDPRHDGGWWHVKADGTVDSSPAGQGVPDDAPSTLAGWYRAVTMPDTATVDLVPLSANAMPTVNPLIISAAAGGLFAALRRSRRPRGMNHGGTHSTV